MNRKIVTLCMGALLLFSCNLSQKAPRLYDVEGKVGAFSYRVKYISKDTTNLERDIDSLVKAVDNSLSAYNPESVISRVNKGYVPVKADEHFKKAFSTAYEVWKQSGGMYDPTVGILVKAWGFGSELIQPISQVPTHEQLDSLKQYVGLQKVQLTTDGYVKKEKREIQIDLNSVMRGYTADVITEFLKSKDIENFVVKIDGEMIAYGMNTIENKPWRIEAQDPYELDEDYKEVVLQLKDESVSTDESYRRVWIDGTGKRFVHIINPFTGRPVVGEMLSATVVAKTAQESDAYATMFMIIGLEKSKEFLAHHPELKALLVYSDTDNKVQTYKTENLKPLLVAER